jgi:hypothetical protein
VRACIIDYCVFVQVPCVVSVPASVALPADDVTVPDSVKLPANVELFPETVAVRLVTVSVPPLPPSGHDCPLVALSVEPETVYFSEQLPPALPAPPSPLDQVTAAVIDPSAFAVLTTVSVYEEVPPLVPGGEVMVDVDEPVQDHVPTNGAVLLPEPPLPVVLLLHADASAAKAMNANGAIRGVMSVPPPWERAQRRRDAGR